MFSEKIRSDVFNPPIHHSASTSQGTRYITHSKPIKRKHHPSEGRDGIPSVEGRKTLSQWAFQGLNYCISNTSQAHHQSRGTHTGNISSTREHTHHRKSVAPCHFVFRTYCSKFRCMHTERVISWLKVSNKKFNWRKNNDDSRTWCRGGKKSIGSISSKNNDHVVALVAHSFGIQRYKTSQCFFTSTKYIIIDNFASFSSSITIDSNVIITKKHTVHNKA